MPVIPSKDFKSQNRSNVVTSESGQPELKEEVAIVWPFKTKVCPRCKVRKHATMKFFNPLTRGKRRGQICWCRKCEVEKSTLWGKNNKEKVTSYHRRSRMKKEYNLSQDGYDLLFNQQDGLCAICKLPPDGSSRTGKILHIDHDHNTGKVRGLLCFPCNAGLGSMRDDPVLLRNGADYLDRHVSKVVTK